MNKLLILGANPAWQKVLFFDEFKKNSINRSTEKLEFASGKGINFARATRCHGRVRPKLLQFNGGKNGEAIDRALQQEGIDFISYPAIGETRCCTSCIDQKHHQVTEIIEPSATVAPEVVANLLRAWQKQLESSAMAAICGTLPASIDGSMYIQAITMAKKSGTPIILDTFKYAEEIFAIGGAVTLKINSIELAQLTGVDDTVQGIKRLFATYPLKSIAITAGANAAYFSDGKAIFSYAMPEVDNIVNTIGCGDTASGVFAAELIEKTPAEEAFQISLGAAMANMLNPFCGNYLPSEALELTNLIKIDKQML